MPTNQTLNKGSIATLLSLWLLLNVQLSFAETREFSQSHLNNKIGQAIFEKLWVFAPASTKSSDGLGPLYNARSCHRCHDLTRRDKSHIPSSLVIQLSIEPRSVDQASKQIIKHTGFIPEPVYGKQIQTFAYPGAKAEAEVSISYKELEVAFPDGEVVILMKPNYQFSNLAYGDLHQNVKFSPRIAPRMSGLALLESIPEEQIIALADPDDEDKDGISGSVNTVWDALSQTEKLGRFGWKAGKANLEQQNLAALSTDIGISSWLFPQAEGDCTQAQTHCIHIADTTQTHLSSSQDHSSQPDALQTTRLAIEASKEMTDLLLLFTTSFDEKKYHRQKPVRSKNSHIKSLSEGQKLFKTIGCQKCHIDAYRSIESDSESVMISATISPYTDLLLHDMGSDLADDRKEFNASGNEWRTAPLWGISGYLLQSPNPKFLHDGRARSIKDAILWHAGEAKDSKRAFMTLTRSQRSTLINFVESL